MSSKQNNVKPNTPKVSVGIPVYNAERYIGPAIESVLSQTFTDFELIVSDDESTDGTEKIIRSFQDPRIRYIKNEDNKFKAPGNFNNCIRHSNGEYIYIFHADDLMLPENLAEKVRFLDKHENVGMVHSNIYRIDSDGNVTDTHWVKDYSEDTIFNGPEYFEMMIAGNNLVCAPAVMVRRECYEKIGDFDKTLSHTCDWEMWMRISLFYDVAYLAKPLVCYRWHEEMDTKNYFYKVKGLDQDHRARLAIINKFPQNIPNFSKWKKAAPALAPRKALQQATNYYWDKNYFEVKEHLKFIFKTMPSLLARKEAVRLLAAVIVGEKGMNFLKKIIQKRAIS